MIDNRWTFYGFDGLANLPPQPVQQVKCPFSSGKCHIRLLYLVLLGRYSFTSIYPTQWTASYLPCTVLVTILASPRRWAYHSIHLPNSWSTTSIFGQWQYIMCPVPSPDSLRLTFEIVHSELLINKLVSFLLKQLTMLLFYFKTTIYSITIYWIS